MPALLACLQLQTLLCHHAVDARSGLLPLVGCECLWRLAHCCSFTGTIPTDWADSRYFLKLKTLDLHDNQLDGTLPNQRWNKKGAFRSLQYLDVSDNGLYGGFHGLTF